MKTRKAQRGVIFLLLMLVLLVTGAAFALGALNNRQTAAIARQVDVYEQLEAARDLLLAYVDYSYEYYTAEPGIIPGLLPCPDVDNDGAAQALADCEPSQDYIGRLPQYIELPDSYPGTNDRFYLNDTFAGIDQQFWYVVSPNFLQTTNGNYPLNSVQGGTLELDGANDIVALIIAPGDAHSDQNRALNPNDPTQYLDGGNGSSLEFWTRYEANPELFNDTLLAITREDVWQAQPTYQLVAEAIHERLKTYYASCGYFPRIYRTTTCSFSWSVTSGELAFRTWVNAGPTSWIKESASGGDDWIASNAMDYAYLATNSARIDFKQYGGGSTCVRYSMSPTVLTGPTTSTC